MMGRKSRRFRTASLRRRTRHPMSLVGDDTDRTTMFIEDGKHTTIFVGRKFGNVLESHLLGAARRILRHSHLFS